MSESNRREKQSYYEQQASILYREVVDIMRSADHHSVAAEYLRSGELDHSLTNAVDMILTALEFSPNRRLDVKMLMRVFRAGKLFNESFQPWTVNFLLGKLQLDGIINRDRRNNISLNLEGMRQFLSNRRDSDNR